MSTQNLRPEQEAELQRLLAAANVYRMRGKWTDAEDSCRAALKLAPGDPQIHEILGDILQECGKLDPALAEYKSAREAGPEKAALETKYAKLVIAIGERERAKAIAQDMLDNPHLYVKRTRKPGAALLLALMPGLGQLYNGEIVKAAVIFGSFLLFVVGMGLFQHYPPNAMSSLSELIKDTNPAVEVLGFIATAAYIYGLIDAPISADKSSKAATEHILK